MTQRYVNVEEVLRRLCGSSAGYDTDEGENLVTIRDVVRAIDLSTTLVVRYEDAEQ